MHFLLQFCCKYFVKQLPNLKICLTFHITSLRVFRFLSTMYHYEKLILILSPNITNLFFSFEMCCNNICETINKCWMIIRCCTSSYPFSAYLNRNQSLIRNENPIYIYTRTYLLINSQRLSKMSSQKQFKNGNDRDLINCCNQML